MTDHPFNELSADILLSSSDNVIFRLHKIILSLASDFFRDMLSLPQPTQSETAAHNLSEADGIPLLNVTEPSQVLERLFRLCYPIDDPALDDVDDVRSTLEAAMKYQMAEAFKITRGKLLALAPVAPLQVYAVACQFGLEEEASAAAEEVLKQKMQNSYVDELEELSIGAYHRLLSYCEARGGVRNRMRFTFHRSGREQPSSSSSSTPLLERAALEYPDAACAPEIAPHPFNLADADVGILTSDGVEFRVLKSILQLSSRVFSSKLAVIPSSQPMLITVPENSRILSILLTICYPTPMPDLADLHDIVAALAAAEKYEIQKASQILRAASMSLSGSPSEDPVLLYAIACRFGMQELATSSARRTLRTDIMQTSVSELDNIGLPAGAFHRLLDYHARCRLAVRTAISHNSVKIWIDSGVRREFRGFCQEDLIGCWLKPYMTRVGEEDWPSGESVRSNELLQSTLIRDGKYFCGPCLTPPGIMRFVSLSNYLAAALEAAEREVPLHHGPP